MKVINEDYFCWGLKTDKVKHFLCSDIYGQLLIKKRKSGTQEDSPPSQYITEFDL